LIRREAATALRAVSDENARGGISPPPARPCTAASITTDGEGDPLYHEWALISGKAVRTLSGIGLTWLAASSSASYIMTFVLSYLRVPRTSALALALTVAFAIPGTAGADTSIKGGFVLHPSERDFSDRWLMTFSLEKPLNIHETFFWGIELQSAFYSIDMGRESAQVLPANGFLNVKWKADKFVTRPYAGAGLGMVTDFIFAGEEKSWNRQIGIHFIGGIEYGRLVAELQMQRRFVEGDSFSYILLFGLVW
jgi:hypothetical protein